MIQKISLVWIGVLGLGVTILFGIILFLGIRSDSSAALTNEQSALNAASAVEGTSDSAADQMEMIIVHKGETVSVPLLGSTIRFDTANEQPCTSGNPELNNTQVEQVPCRPQLGTWIFQLTPQQNIDDAPTDAQEDGQPFVPQSIQFTAIPGVFTTENATFQIVEYQNNTARLFIRASQ